LAELRACAERETIMTTEAACEIVDLPIMHDDRGMTERHRKILVQACRAHGVEAVCRTLKVHPRTMLSVAVGCGRRANSIVIAQQIDAGKLDALIKGA
jgi:hypothetical protein